MSQVQSKALDNEFARWREEAKAVKMLPFTVKRRIPLRRQGAEWVGACPRCGGHDRFSINPNLGVFNCRGFGGGDIIDMVMHIDDCDMITAIETLTGRPSPNNRNEPAKEEPADNVAAFPTKASTNDTDLERLKEVALSVDAAAYLKSIRNNFKYPSWYSGHRYGARLIHCPKCGPGFELSVRKGESKFSCTKFNRIDGKYDFQQGPKGSVVEMVMHLDGCDELTACKKLAEFAERNGGSNVTKLPARKYGLPRLTDEYVDAVYRRNAWKEVAEYLRDERIKTWYSQNLYKFVDDMSRRKERPTAPQLGLLIGLVVNVQLQMSIDEIERPEREAEEKMRAEIEKEVRRRMAERKAAQAGESNVVPLSPKG